jgi:hypothetical protein
VASASTSPGWVNGAGGMLCGSVSWGMDTQVPTQCGAGPAPISPAEAAAGVATATADPETKANSSRRVGPVGMAELLVSTDVMCQVTWLKRWERSHSFVLMASVSTG